MGGGSRHSDPHGRHARAASSRQTRSSWRTDRNRSRFRLPYSKRQRTLVRLAHRLLLQSLAIVAVLVVSVVVIIDNQLYSSITEQAVQDLAGEARFLATRWKSGVDPDSLADEAGA